MIIAVNFQLKQPERRSLKKFRASTGFEPVTPVTSQVATNGRISMISNAFKQMARRTSDVI